MPYRTRIAAAIIALFSAGVATAAPPKVVAGPNSDPQCFAPWATNTKMFSIRRRRARTGSRWPMATLPTPGASR